MHLRKSVLGMATATLLVASLGAGVCYGDESYAPTTLGNSDYTNYVDLRNDIVVTGMNYVGPMASQNSDALAAAAALPNQFGTQGENAYALTVTNALGKDITALAVKASGETSFTDLGLTSAIAANKGQACWWYTQTYSEVQVTNRSGVVGYMPVNYTFQATLADGTVAEFHNVNLKGVLTLTFCYSGEYQVHYVERTTITNHTPDPNLVYEYNLARGYAADSDMTYTAEEMDYHVNSCLRMGDRMYTASRGGGWEVSIPVWSDVDYSPDFGVYVPLYGEPSKAFTNGTYAHLYWNKDLIQWRVNNGDAGTWAEAGDVEGAGEYGGAETNRVDIHPGMEDGDWWYTSGE